MRGVLSNIKGFASEVFLVDSGSTDGTLDIAQENGVNVVHHRFEGFGAQWNFAIDNLPISQPFTMKLDPDERLGDDLKKSIRHALESGEADGLILQRRLWFMGKPMPVRQDILRVWRTGRCRFTDTAVNEHPVVTGKIERVKGDMEHHDSPNLHHWFEKQNYYTTAEAKVAFEGGRLAAEPKLFGNGLERRMWLKRNYRNVPLRHTLMFLYCYLVMGAWRAGRAGYIWARLRADVYRTIEYKIEELVLSGGARSLTSIDERHQ